MDRQRHRRHLPYDALNICGVRKAATTYPLGDKKERREGRKGLRKGQTVNNLSRDHKATYRIRNP